MSPARQRVTLRLMRRDEPIKFSIALVVTRKLRSAGGSRISGANRSRPKGKIVEGEQTDECRLSRPALSSALAQTPRKKTKRHSNPSGSRRRLLLIEKSSNPTT